MALVIKTSNYLAFSPAFLFWMREYVKLLETGNTHPCLEFDNETPVVYAVQNGEIVGAQLYKIDRLGRCYTVGLCVSETNKGQGIATAIYEKMREIAVAKGCTIVYTSVISDNESSLRYVAKGGRKQFVSKFAEFLA